MAKTLFFLVVSNIPYFLLVAAPKLAPSIRMGLPRGLPSADLLGSPEATVPQ